MNLKHERKYNYIYQTKNLVNNKTYIGIHCTDNLNDGYVGSGVLLVKAMAKYGDDNFKTTILSHFDTYAEALAEEEALVTQEWVDSKCNYNLKLGGKATYWKQQPSKPWKHKPFSFEGVEWSTVPKFAENYGVSIAQAKRWKANGAFWSNTQRNKYGHLTPVAEPKGD